MQHRSNREPVRCVGSFVWWLVAGSVALFALTGCSEGVLATHGPIAGVEKQLLIEALVCMLIVVIPVIGLTLFFAWRYRASNRSATYLPNWSYSGRIEFSIWIIPMLVILFLACLAWSGAHELDPYKSIRSDKAPLEVDVVSMDWKWLFIYPDQKIATVNNLEVPIGRPIEFHLTSGTVMNSFYMPGLAGQIYTMAGMQTRLSVLVTDVGIYRGMSSQFSGDGFSDMNFRVSAVDDAAFNNWVDKVRRQSTGTMNDDVYDALVSARKTQPPAYYSDVAGDVFGHALTLHDAPSAIAHTTAMAMPSPSSSAGP